MSPEELRQKIAALGIDADNPSWGKSAPTDLGRLPIIQKQRDALAKVRDLLAAQVQGDEAQIQALREQLARLHRGGGQ
jgi:hypothetical protein